MKYKHLSRKVTYYLLAVYTFLSVQVTYCQTTDQNGDKKKMERVPSPNRVPTVYEQAHQYENVLSKQPAERNSELWALVEGMDDTLAAMAGTTLISNHVFGSADRVAARIGRWSPANQLACLQVLQAGRLDKSFLRIPRAVIQGTTIPSDESGRARSRSPLDVAVLLLAENGTESTQDLALLSALAFTHPRSRGLWLALTALKVTDNAVLRVAAETYNNTTVSDKVRVAAATTLARQDASAGEFAADRIRAYIVKSGQRDLSSLLAEATTGGAGNEKMAELSELREQLFFLSSLRFLDTRLAKSLTFDFLNSRNEEVRTVLALIASERWPSDFLLADHGAFTTDEYESLLAATAFQHPELTPTILKTLSSDRLHNLLPRLQDAGIAGFFGLPGIVVLGG